MNQLIIVQKILLFYSFDYVVNVKFPLTLFRRVQNIM